MAAIYREGYFKVSRRILDSSLFCEEGDVIKVFLALVAMSQDPGGPRNGCVFIARRQLAAKVFLPEDRLDECIDVLAGADIESRTQVADGRRIEVLQNGFRVLNYGLYHDEAKDRCLSLLRAEAGRAGGIESAKSRSRKRKRPSKIEASPKQKPLTETETRRRQDGDGADTTTAPATPTDPVDVFISVFNAVFERRVGFLPTIKAKAVKRLASGIEPWMLVATPLLVAAQGLSDSMRKVISPEILLRDGNHPRTSADGRTCGGTDWLERAFLHADQTALNQKLSDITRAADEKVPGLLDGLMRRGVKITGPRDDDASA